MQPGAEPAPADLLGDAEPGAAQPGTVAESGPEGEAHQAMEHLLRRVPDDPAGLLRQRFLLQHLRRSGQL
jgi:Ca-activated chloride channel family protein